MCFLWKHKAMDANDVELFESPGPTLKKKKVAQTFDGKLVYERYFKPLTRLHPRFEENKEQHLCTCGVIRTNKISDGYSNLTFQHIYKSETHINYVNEMKEFIELKKTNTIDLTPFLHQ